MVNARIRKKYSSVDALHFLMSICVTGGISGAVTRRLRASQIEIAVRENPSQLCLQESTLRMTIPPVHLREPSYHTERHSIAYVYSLLKNNLLFIPKKFPSPINPSANKPFYLACMFHFPISHHVMVLQGTVIFQMSSHARASTCICMYTL